MSAPYFAEDYCDAVMTGYCDHYLNPNWDHACQDDAGHDGAHECGCGLRWTERDDD